MTHKEKTCIIKQEVSNPNHGTIRMDDYLSPYVIKEKVGRSVRKKINISLDCYHSIYVVKNSVGHSVRKEVSIKID